MRVRRKQNTGLRLAGCKNNMRRASHMDLQLAQREPPLPHERERSLRWNSPHFHPQPPLRAVAPGAHLDPFDFDFVAPVVREQSIAAAGSTRDLTHTSSTGHYGMFCAQ